eukprot:CAMPEP_0203960590 /NCGR_PEP_ID=MMETSP0359-20131031/91247_1 /ASSEMBLY_ACC=CAM_ASM_000338 /TAXON_ID=268821 /ORGANISM="Scrippsiella Hangoei, Strain SHTV-5" /LENGTH=67 /DNA_ID=CAMNT_0050894999 /DNA_START=12 /DNA_END=212 /DNA_ORIENTATION=+
MTRSAGSNDPLDTSSVTSSPQTVQTRRAAYSINGRPPDVGVPGGQKRRNLFELSGCEWHMLTGTKPW